MTYLFNIFFNNKIQYKNHKEISFQIVVESRWAIKQTRIIQQIT